MVSNYFKPLNILCIICYIIFMGVAFDSGMVDALVLFVSEHGGKPVYLSGKLETAEITGPDAQQPPIVAIRYRTSATVASIASASDVVESAASASSDDATKSSAVVEMKTMAAAASVDESSSLEMAFNSAAAEVTAKNEPSAVETVKPKLDNNKAAKNSDSDNTASALSYIDAISRNKWEFATLLDRYIVRYDDDTYIVLTIRPSLQKQLEETINKYSTRIAVGIIQEPSTGEILAMVSSHRNQTLDIESDEFKTENWALKPTFPVASIYKIITGAAGIDTGKISAESSFIAWGKSYMKVWKAFARSHNGVFGRIARKIGRDVVAKYSNAFGFNKPFFFDLPVGKSLAELPHDQIKMGQAAAGLNRDFLVSPMHVASIISTVLNRGKTMKPYLVDYVVRKNKVVFRRKPFQLAQPIKASTAKEIYKMMYGTTSNGTGKKGFGGYKSCPDLSKICGGKTGTLTGASPHYLFTWFGGFTKATGRDLCVVTLVGQQNHSGTKASSIAGQISYELYMKRHGKSTGTVAKAHRSGKKSRY
ncbi:MAG: penicillin-binding transpeptidase domain-containing protein [Candidatus Riflebacteria bacterium]|nr:penicillin-binding transpeptidase domain-containing protein [Candidatus Riflebacteria bacterium]